MRLLKKLFNRNPKTKATVHFQKFYIDKDADIEFLYYSPQNGGASMGVTLFWLRSREAHINANVSFSYGDLNGHTGIKVSYENLQTQQLIPENKVLVISRGKLEIVDLKCIKLLYGKKLSNIGNFKVG